MKYYKFTETDAESDEKWVDIVENKNTKELENYYKQYGFGVENLLNGFFKLRGWKYETSHVCKCFLVRLNYDNHFLKFYAPNKTSLYNALGGSHKIAELIEYKGAEMINGLKEVI